MTRADVFNEVLRTFSSHNGGNPGDLIEYRDAWTEAPWTLPQRFTASAGVCGGSEDRCSINSRTLRFEADNCSEPSIHASRERQLNAAREWWLNDQKTWPTPNSGDGCTCGTCATCRAQPAVTVGDYIDARPPLATAIPTTLPDFVSTEEFDAMVTVLVSSGANQQAAIAATHAVIKSLIAPTGEACREAAIHGIALDGSYLRRYSLLGGVGRIARLTKHSATAMRKIFGNVEAFTAALCLNPSPKKTKGALPKMARKSLGSRLKKNSVKALKSTGGEVLKDVTRPVLQGMLQATPLGPAGAQAILDSPHGDAALGVLASVAAMLFLPEKLANNPHIDEMLDDLQTSSLKHFTDGTYKTVAAPLKAAIAGELTAYAERMEALTAGAVGALAAGKTEAE